MTRVGSFNFWHSRAAVNGRPPSNIQVPSSASPSERHFSAFTLAVVVIALIPSCKPSVEPEIKQRPEQVKEALVEANKHLVRTEAEDIDAYVARHNWQLAETGSGLRYEIYQKGNGLHAKKDQVARIHYKLGLLTGKVCYTSKERGPKEFQIGRGGVESGLEEAILLMREGDRGRFILPSHLAHGLLGDDDCIPAKSVVVYDVQLIALLDQDH